MSGSQDGSQVRKGLDSHLWIADHGTALPEDLSTPMGDLGFFDIGFTSPDGESMNVEPNVEDHIPHQSFRPVRSDVTEQAETFAFTVWQRNAETVKLAFGGGTVTQLASGLWKYVPPSPGDTNDKVFVLETFDGEIHDRWCCARGKPRLTSGITFNKTDISAFEMEIKVLEHVGGEPWCLLSNDEGAFGDGGS